MQPIGTTDDAAPPRADSGEPPARVEPAPRPAPASVKRRRASASRTPRRDEPRKSVFQRELFRIVFR